MGRVPQTQEAAIFTQADRMRLSGPRVCFVLGLAEGEFPRAAGASGLLTHTDRELLVRRGVEMPGSYENRTLLEQMYFYRALAAPRGRLYLSCTAAGDAQPCAALAPRAGGLGPEKDVLSPVAACPYACGCAAALQRALRPENTPCGGPARGAAKRGGLCPCAGRHGRGRRAAALPCRGYKGAGAAFGHAAHAFPYKGGAILPLPLFLFSAICAAHPAAPEGRALAAGKRQPRALYSRACAAPRRRALCRA